MKKIDPQHLCDMAHYRAEERGQAGQDAISIQIAYALANPGINHFGVLYRTDAPLCLHKAMADMVIAAALDLQKNHGWRLKLMDGLRTIDAQIAMEKSEHTDPAWYANSMLSAAGKGAHPKGGMAVDLMPIDAAGNEIDMGTAFDSLDPVRAARHYTGDGISDAAKHHRLIVERAMQRAALAQGKLLAPLRSEHWDYRFPENFQDGWRVLESLCRVADVPFDEALKTVEMTDYRSFCEHWARVFASHETELQQAVGVACPPASEQTIIYHGDFLPMLDADLPPKLRQCLHTSYAAEAKLVQKKILAGMPGRGP